MVIRALSVLSLVAMYGCTARTEVIVVTDTDLSIPDEVDSFRIDVTAPGGEMQSSTATFEPGELGPPRALGLVNDSGRLGPYTVRAQAVRRSGVVVERTAIFTFQSQRTLVLQIDLARSCLGRTCPLGQTCADGACRSTQIFPNELEDYQGALPVGDTIGGTPDAGSGCRAESCNSADDDCDGRIDESFDLTSDRNHCGTCNNFCTRTNGTSSCVDSVCVPTACNPGYDDCDGMPANGCETDLTQPDTCGSCGVMCVSPRRNCCPTGCCA